MLLYRTKKNSNFCPIAKQFSSDATDFFFHELQGHPLGLGFFFGLAKCFHRGTHVSCASHWPKNHQAGEQTHQKEEHVNQFSPTTPPSECPDPLLLLATPHVMEPVHSASRSKLAISFFGAVAVPPPPKMVCPKKNHGETREGSQWQITGKSLANQW